MDSWDIISFIWPANAQWYIKAIFPSFDISPFFFDRFQKLPQVRTAWFMSERLDGTGYAFPVQSGETIYGSAFNSLSR